MLYNSSPAYKALTMKPRVMSTGIAQGKMSLTCEFKTLPGTTTSYAYTVYWYAGMERLHKEEISAGDVTVDAIMKTTRYVDIDKLSKGVS